MHIELEKQHASFIQLQLGNCDIREVVQIRRLSLSVKAVANDLQAKSVSPNSQPWLFLKAVKQLQLH